uniref:Major lipid droplet protein n=1 Tax=Dunaliella parva TaxID=3048 RepID=G9L6P6_9CHLO|nr:major lipid droplet protein [Dunaliella parva]
MAPASKTGPKGSTTPQAPTPNTAGPQLRRLGFVRSYAGSAASLLAPILLTVQSFGDRVLESVGTKESLAAYTTPLLERTTDIGDSLLSTVDQQVDYMLNTGNSMVRTTSQTVTDSVSGVRDIHNSNLSYLSNAFQTLLTNLQRTTDWAIENLNPVRIAHTGSDWAKATFVRAQELLDPDTLYNFLQERWAAVSSIPVVKGMLDTAQPITNASWSAFVGLHDFLVNSSLYKFSVDSGFSAWGWAKSTTPYKLGMQYLYPIVQPVADPAIHKVSSSKVVNSVLDYWAPTPNAAAAAAAS